MGNAGTAGTGTSAATGAAGTGAAGTRATIPGSGTQTAQQPDAFDVSKYKTRTDCLNAAQANAASRQACKSISVK